MTDVPAAAERRGFFARKAYESLVRRTSQATAGFDAKSALVVAPHQDDETLGCGGVIARKVRADAAVSVAFLTDGGGSHAHLIDRDELCRLRKSEALDACRVLGIPASRVHFMEVPDGALAQSEGAAATFVSELLAELRPQQVFTPHAEDMLSDHVAANRIVHRALGKAPQRTTVCEYPIWLWDRWPWTNPIAFPRQRHGGKSRGKFALSALDWRMHRHFTTRVDVGGTLESKRAALATHLTQVTRFNGDPGWLTLSDIDHGNWLANSLGKYEFFRETEFGE
ncbi:MAG: PIG-L deacetylase family protein [Dehalococcoidia bacterium]